MIFFHVRDDVDDDLAVGSERFQESLLPDSEFFLRTHEQLFEQPLKRIPHSRVGNVPLELVEFAGDEEPVFFHQGFMDFVDQRGLADAGIAGDHEHFSATGHDARKALLQNPGFVFAAVQFLRDLKFDGVVAAADREILDVSGLSQLPAAVFQIPEQTSDAVVTILGLFGHELENDVFYDVGRVAAQAAYGRRRFGNVAVHPADGVVGLEGMLAREHFVQRNAERIVVRTVVYSAVHSAGLFRGHVRKGAFQRTGADGFLFLLFQKGGKVKINELQFAAGFVDQHVVRIHVFVDHA